MVYELCDFKYIDAHTHFFPPTLFKAIWDYFELPDNDGNPQGWNINYKLKLEDLLNFLRQRGVKYLTTFNYAHKIDISESINDWTFQFTQNHQDAIGFGCCWPGDTNK